MPFITKSVNSPLVIGFMVTIGSVLLILDNTSRNMLVDQVFQIMALFQNDNGKLEPIDTSVSDQSIADNKTAVPSTNAYKRPHYYL